MMGIKPTDNEIDDVLNHCLESEDTGESIYPGMTYEQGVKAAIEWLDPNHDGSHPINE